jgi:HAD superfamily hydrolase (TIGR01509 family)
MERLQAVIFGAIGTIVETSDIQRQAFNAAFQSAGLDWNWSPDTYRTLLKINGGQNRILAYRNADPVRAEVPEAMIAKLHKAKTDFYVAMLDETPIAPRPGVLALMDACASAHIRVAFCTSTYPENVAAIGAALDGLLSLDRFATIVTIDKIARPKPAPDAYLYCLEQLNLKADEVIAIEDTPASLAAAKAAGIKTIATPGATTNDQDFGAADLVVPDLTGMTIERLSALLDESRSPEMSGRGV